MKEINVTFQIKSEEMKQIKDDSDEKWAVLGLILLLKVTH